MAELIYRGAEAELWKHDYLGIPCVHKVRVPKSYRVKELDERIRSQRVKTEAQLITQAHDVVETPRVLDVDLKKKSITLELVEGSRLRDTIEAAPNIARAVGIAVAALHGLGIVHGDLTTSNIIMRRSPVFIDFGLAYRSDRLEDKAVDLTVFKKMLLSTHFRKFREIWGDFYAGYASQGDERVLRRIEKIEARARYAEK
ncbi:Kae1-associated serine/threonine protein kinase [Candidatus Micrarchaeota archaeon]|nr:Kae1-associated serine/threonine protein kinase [Candidatus Micrarchaeota archaeon]